MAILATKGELKAEKDKVLKLQTFDWSYFWDKSHFENDVTQNYLVFQPIFRFKNIGNTEGISSWKSKGLSDEFIRPPTTFGNSLAAGLSYTGNKTRVKFDGLVQNKTKSHLLMELQWIFKLFMNYVFQIIDKVVILI